MEVTNDAIIKDLQRVAKALKKDTLSVSKYEEYGKYPGWEVETMFGGWNKALQASGLKVYYESTNISKEELIKDLQRVAKKLKDETLSPSEYEEYGKFQYWELKVKFGGWNKALQASDLKCYFESTNISKEEIIKDLRNVAKILNTDSFSRHDYKLYGKHFYGNLKHHFVSWKKAIETAGLKKLSGQNATTNELIYNLKEIEKKLGRLPKITDITSKTSRYSLNDYKLRFGKWKRALEAAGANITILQEVSNEELITNLQEIEQKLGRVPLRKELKHPLSKYLEYIYKERFGKWKNALKAAGFDAVNFKSVSDEELINNIKVIAEKLGRVPKMTDITAKTSSYSLNDYKLRFGRWKSALELAGFKLKRSRYKKENIKIEDLLENFTEVYTKLGRIPKSSEMKKPLSKYVVYEYVKKFGSWSKTLEYMGLDNYKKLKAKV